MNVWTLWQFTELRSSSGAQCVFIPSSSMSCSTPCLKWCFTSLCRFLGVPPGRGSCPLTGPLPFDLIYTDYHGLQQMKQHMGLSLKKHKSVKSVRVCICVYLSLCVCVCVSAAEFCFYTWKVSNYSISPPDSKSLCFFPSSSSSCQTSHTAPCGGIHSVAVVFLLALSAFSFFIIIFFFTMSISCIVLELSTAGHCLPRPGLHIYARKIYFDISLSVWGHLSDCLSPGFRAADVTAASDFTWTTAATESRARLRSRTQSLWSILDRYRASSN